VECSFAGGCKYAVSAEGLTTMMQNQKDKVSINVCEKPCEFISEGSNN